MRGARLECASIKSTSGVLDFLPPYGMSPLVVAAMRPEVAEIELAGPTVARLWVGHADAVWCLASIGGDEVLSAGKDRTVRLWRRATGEAVHAYDGHSDNIWSIAVAPSGQAFATASSDRSVCLWRRQPGLSVRAHHLHADEVRGVAFASPDVIVSCGLDGRVIAWNARTNAHLEVTLGVPLFCLEVDPDRGRILVGDAAGCATLLSASDLHVVARWQLHAGAVRSIAVDQLGRQVATGGGDGVIALVTPADGTTAVAATGLGIVTRVRFDTAGTLYASTYDTIMSRFPNVGGVAQRVDLSAVLYHEKSQFSCQRLVLSADCGLPRERLQALVARGAVVHPAP